MAKAKGQLRHHFWGTYYATIALDFGKPEVAKQFLESGKLLGDWKQSKDRDSCLVTMVDNDGLDLLVEQLVGWGAEKKKITSVAKSIDFGEPFWIECSIPVGEQTEMEF